MSCVEACYVKNEQFEKIENRKRKQVSGAQTLRSSIARSLGVIFVASFFAAIVGGVLPGSVSAGQVTNRSITMSSSAASATSVTYTVAFTPATSETHPDLIINFCNSATDPIPGDTCSGTAGTDVPDLSSVPSSCATGWTCTAVDSNRSLKLTTSSNSFTSGTPTSIAITGVTNMSTVGGFYGRILVYATGGTSGYVSPTSPGSYQDYGGIALSTAANISITSKVFETLSYCVFQSSCGTAPALTLGDATTGALSSTNAYVNNNAQYTIATNAASGAAVAMRGTTLCRSATPANCNTGAASVYTITSIGTTSGFTTSAISSVGSEQFGMCADTTGASGGLAAQPPYDDPTASACHTGLSTGIYSGSSQFGFDDNTASGGSNNASGSTLLQSTGPISSYTGTFAFLGNISTTTEPGIYTTSLNTVATGMF